MAPEPLVKPLSHGNRVWLFRALFGVFLLAMPVFVFYAMGYRVDLTDSGAIVTVGGLYIDAAAVDAAIFVDDAPVTNLRIFQNAAYVQDLEAGMHNVRVESDGLITWNKNLPVYPHIVTEAQAFNVPVVPQIRYIPEWLTSGGVPVYILASSRDIPFPNASTTNAIVATTSTSLRTYSKNSELEYVESLFAESSDEDDVRRAVDVFQSSVVWSGAAEFASSTVSTTTRIMHNMRLFEAGSGVRAEWIGQERSIPYYFCVTYTSPEATTLEYGEGVYRSIEPLVSTTTAVSTPAAAPGRICRDSIEITGGEGEILWFDFVPNSMHHVLALKENGLYVIEIDDRSGQNAQLLYPGQDLQVRVDGGRIYVHDGTRFIEVFTEIPL